MDKNNMKYFLLILLIFKFHAPSESLKLKDLRKSAVNIVSGVAEKIPDAIPSAEDLFQFGKNLLAGYPFEMIFSVINRFCSAAISAQNVKPQLTPDITNMSYVLMRNKKSNVSIPLNQVQKLFTIKEFDTQLPLVILFTGWTTSVNNSDNPALNLLWSAYRCRGNVNFVVVDTAGFIDSLYTWSAYNTEEIGKIISKSLARLIETYPIEKIQLIGHSLGAHIAGSVGRNLNYRTDKLIPRIVGLDPANPCFNSGENLTGLNRGDGQFVLVIHSNPGGLGKRDPLGDADFFPNGVNPLPPGCSSISCAHQRAVEFFAESVYPGNENNFMSVKCGSLSALLSNYCHGKAYPMGYATPHNLKGNFFLKTNEKSPFGLNATKNAIPKCNN